MKLASSQHDTFSLDSQAAVMASGRCWLSHFREGPMLPDERLAHLTDDGLRDTLRRRVSRLRRARAVKMADDWVDFHKGLVMNAAEALFRRVAGEEQ